MCVLVQLACSVGAPPASHLVWVGYVGEARSFAVRRTQSTTDSRSGVSFSRRRRRSPSFSVVDEGS